MRKAPLNALCSGYPKFVDRLLLFNGEAARYRVGLVTDCAEVVAKSRESEHVDGIVARFEKIEPPAHRPAGTNEFVVIHLSRQGPTELFILARNKTLKKLEFLFLFLYQVG